MWNLESSRFFTISRKFNAFCSPSIVLKTTINLFLNQGKKSIIFVGFFCPKLVSKFHFGSDHIDNSLKFAAPSILTKSRWFTARTLADFNWAWSRIFFKCLHRNWIRQVKKIWWRSFEGFNVYALKIRMHDSNIELKIFQCSTGLS